ncbi:type I DNA topoisomerase [Rhodoligotrophos defluvii]|uniref:type I DNA topoisomerase n=1 Tax=Rhodoligotrophos defluvii TaxID=2561934 RepID=UPI0010C9D116|nr:type I DNA topoisomerase [Rhodoligotrophos defluvii]
MTVVVVESPAKAKTINKYLGSDYTVLASFGHVRDLPAKDGSVRPDEDFAMSWEVDAKAKKRLDDIARALKSSPKLILATDPDREGEAISWHVLEVLKKKGLLKDKRVERVAFNAVTKSAVSEAIRNPREIDDDLVEAYLARRALDYLVGFTLSPVLWRKLPGARSAGRVQSVALRLVCAREIEIERFKRQEYWSIEAAMRTKAGEPFDARLAEIDGRRLDRLEIGDGTTANRIVAALRNGRFTIRSVESKPARRNPQPPFITSTLQQEASRKLGFSSKHTMQLAQRLYEGVDIGGETVGLITYMRTDGVQMAEEAITAARSVIGKTYGQAYVPQSPRRYTTKARNAQEAHEAIRPTDLARTPQQVERALEPDMARLYELIWKRTIASQMESAEIERTTVDISTTGSDGREHVLRATGSVVRFDGFLRLYQEGRDDEDESEDGRRLPPMREGEPAELVKLSPVQHFTEPPPRYTEASLIRKMEELGIGRPSTYTAILTTLRDRGYVRLDKKRLLPEDKGRLVTAFLEGFFRRYVEYDFTANLEEQLDRISNGDIDWKAVLRDFWTDFIGAVESIQELRVSDVLEELNEILGPHIFPPTEDGGDPRQCPNCGNGRLSLKTGKFGAFIGCSNYPECRYTRQLGDGEQEKSPAASPEGLPLGVDPETGLNVTLFEGRFGPYVQLGSAEGEEKPKRASIPKGTAIEDVDLEMALRLLSLPREIGLHPETKQPITANFGRFGPFVKHGNTYANLEGPEDVFTIGLNRAVALLAEKEARGGRRPGPQVLKELGEHPQGGGSVQVLSGRYGPYVKYGKVNATLPKALDPEAVTMEQAVELIAQKAGDGAGGKARAKSGNGKAKVAKANGKAEPKSAAGSAKRQKPAGRAAGTRSSTAKVSPSKKAEAS